MAEWHHVTCDELQDSILHLLLFSLNINNIREHLLKSYKFSYDLQINMCVNLKLERVILLLWKLKVLVTQYHWCYSPSHLTSKKSNELLMGGLHSIKSAATSVVKKFDEIKEAISANSTPIKTSSLWVL